MRGDPVEPFTFAPPARPKAGERYHVKRLGATWVWNGERWEIDLKEHFGLARMWALKFVRRMIGPHLKLEDTEEYADALLGLVEASRRYDPTRGFRFSTFATWWLRQSVNRGRDDRGTSHNPKRKRRGEELLFSQMACNTDVQDEPFEIAIDPIDSDEACEVAISDPFLGMWKILEMVANFRERRLLYKIAVSDMTLEEVAAEETPRITRERVRQIVLRATTRLRLRLIQRGYTVDGAFDKIFRLIGAS